MNIGALQITKAALRFPKTSKQCPISSNMQLTANMSTSSRETRNDSHYNDWPNAIGFDSHYEERNPVQLRVEGTIPSYASGTLFRTGCDLGQ